MKKDSDAVGRCQSKIRPRFPQKAKICLGRDKESGGEAGSSSIYRAVKGCGLAFAAGQTSGDAGGLLANGGSQSLDVLLK